MVVGYYCRKTVGLVFTQTSPVEVWLIRIEHCSIEGTVWVKDIKWEFLEVKEDEFLKKMTAWKDKQMDWELRWLNGTY